MSNNPWEQDTSSPSHQPPTGKNTSIAFWIVIGLLLVFTLVAYRSYQGSWLPKKNPHAKEKDQKVVFKQDDLHFAFTLPDINVYKVQESDKQEGKIAANISINKDIFITEYKLKKPVTLTKKNYKDIWYQLTENASAKTRLETTRSPALSNIGKDGKILSVRGQVKAGKNKIITNNLWFYFTDSAQVQVNCQGKITNECKSVLHSLYVPPQKKKD